MGEGLDSVFVKTLMGSNLYIRVTSYEINCNTRVTMDNSLSVLFAYAFASGLDTSRAGTRQIFFFPFLSTDSRQPTAYPSISSVAILVVGTSQRKKTFYQEFRCMLRGGFELGIWWV
jgi:hypothetical protein